MRLRSEERPPYRPMTGARKNTTPVAVLIDFALYWASLIFLRAVQLEVELRSAIVVLFVDGFLPFLQSGPGSSRGVVVV